MLFVILSLVIHFLVRTSEFCNKVSIDSLLNYYGMEMFEIDIFIFYIIIGMDGLKMLRNGIPTRKQANK